MLFDRSREEAPPADDDEFSGAALALLDALYGTALRLTRDGDRAQDLVQDTYLKAFRARRRFVDGTDLKAWLFTIMHNTWRNRRRNQARARVEFDSEKAELAGQSDAASPALTVENPETILLRAGLAAELQTALGRLPEMFREAVWLRDVEDLSYQDIAGVLDIPIGTVMSRISRGEAELRRQLSDSSAVEGRKIVQLGGGQAHG